MYVCGVCVCAYVCAHVVCVCVCMRVCVHVHACVHIYGTDLFFSLNPSYFCLVYSCCFSSMIFRSAVSCIINFVVVVSFRKICGFVVVVCSFFLYAFVFVFCFFHHCEICQMFFHDASC